MKCQTCGDNQGQDNVAVCYKLDCPYINSYRRNIIAKIDKQIAKGVNKYGQKLEKNDISMKEKLNHLEEELVDALFYIQHLKEEDNNE